MKKRTIYEGLGTALVTPFCDGEIDYPALYRLIDEQVKSGVDAIIFGGTTAEVATLSDTERYTLYERAVEYTAGRCRVVLGTGTNDTAKAITHTRFATALPIDGILAVTPYYNKGTEEGILSHYRLLADTATVPLMLYNVPGRTGVNLSLRVLAELSEHENIVAIKEAADSADRLVQLSGFGERLRLYAGNDSQIFTVLALGGGGAVSVASNLCPGVVKDIFRKYSQGQQAHALRAQLDLMPLIEGLFLETNPAPVKYAMAVCGKCRPELRLPLSLPKAETQGRLRAVMERMGLIC